MGSSDTYVRFVHAGSTASGKTNIWQVLTDGEEPYVLGEIKWYGSWRGYAFFPARTTLYEHKCLREIADFIEDRTDFHYMRGSYKP